LARQKDGAIYWKSNRDLLPDEEKVMFKLPQTFADIGVTWKESSTSKNLAAVPDEEFEEEIQKIIQDKKPLTKTAMLRAVAKNKTSVPTEIPDNIYKIIYADPPWQYVDKPAGAAENQPLT
jgi:16S rRNA G966 N2-methylase RsmD